MNRSRLKKIADFVIFCYSNGPAMRAILVALLAAANASDARDLISKTFSLVCVAAYFIAELVLHFLDKVGVG